MASEIYIQDELRTVVENVAKALVMPVKYMFAVPEELIKEIQNLNKHDIQSQYIYPLIAVVADVEETKGTRRGIYSEVSVNQILIACRTLEDYTSAERLEKSFKQVLQPVYTEFIKQIHKHPQFTSASVELIPHTKTDRLGWGRRNEWGTGVAVDNIDAIEITNLEIVVKTKVC